jgi:hypothetical protein
MISVWRANTNNSLPADTTNILCSSGCCEERRHSTEGEEGSRVSRMCGEVVARADEDTGCVHERSQENVL